ncbi:phosphatase PAP2 family protein [Actinoallomurus rhizosphaericola]|uniref:phosphatase PAP2 family protein n=1 Tax=Actinoallomurus rhizosphaericola TaxID=2952536 RepID=UPI002093D582|nr:phosphatase PAP2 family protein [Actinoallomurus rhizosphaericola]MCO5996450.1 phosphatase PAP2 family protein [Actinoallomurus rhizosphaericola]
MAQLAAPRPVDKQPAVSSVRSPALRLWRELALAAAFYCAYTLVRLLIPHDETAAYAHASQVLRLEHTLGIDVELDLNHALLRAPSLAKPANWFYATAHFAVTLTVLVWLYRRRPEHFHRLRTALMVATGIALLGFWLYPLAPPRFLGGRGFVDPVVALHSFGLYSSPEAGSLTNQFAAMPSMHAGWALWCAVAVVTLSKRPWVRAIAALYPVVTILVIFSTANHYVVDAVAGVVITASALLIGRLSLAKMTRIGPMKDHKVTNKTSNTDGSPDSI